MHLLIVEDDPKLGRLLKRLLEEDRHVVELATDGQAGLETALEGRGIEALILDVGLPDISGLDVASRLRDAGSTIAILMLTARDTVGDRVTGLDSGADDYLVKPFAFQELTARLRALSRRSTTLASTGTRLVHGAIELDEGMRRVAVDSRSINLSPREFALLECLLRHPGQVMTREVTTCGEDDTVASIMERMTAGKFRHLPVIAQGRIAGLISIGETPAKSVVPNSARRTTALPQ